jgi:hypothetical protein
MNKKSIIIVSAVIVVLIVGGFLFKKSHNTQTLKMTDQKKVSTQKPVANTASTKNVSGTSDATPSKDLNVASGIAEKPTFVENPIKNDATTEGFKIVDALVENNIDPTTKKDVNDHLELSLKNISEKDMTDFEIYYTITDPAANVKEGYYHKLTGLILKSGETKSIHFDNGTGDGHFSENMNSIYRTTNPAKLFDVILSSPGYKIETTQINKDPGGAEKAD